jgi:5'(3')-deoxyribonucleotidase
MSVVVGVDLDGILADFTGLYVECANKRYGRPPLGTTASNWDMSNITPTKEEADAVWADMRAIPNFWETMKVYPEVSRGLVYLLDRQNEVYFPTARALSGPDLVSRQSAIWLRSNFGIEYPRVILSEEKGPLAKALKYDFFIDDRPKNCVAIKDACPDCRVFLKNLPHNASWKEPFNIKRIATVNEFCELILNEGR